MSKELTEQYFNATLKAGTYYVLDRDGNIDIDYYGGDNFQWSVVKEILAPVPSYDEWQELQEASDGLSKTMFKSLMNRFVKADEERERLQKKLDVAIATLELLEIKSDKFNSSMGLVEQLDDIKADCQATLHHLKEMEEV